MDVRPQTWILFESRGLEVEVDRRVVDFRYINLLGIVKVEGCYTIKTQFFVDSDRLVGGHLEVAYLPGFRVLADPFLLLTKDASRTPVLG